MTVEFTSLNLRPELVQAVAAMGYEAPTPIQARIIPLMLDGADVIGQAQTGTGKTAAFALPILHQLETGLRMPQALIVTPTRELALQISPTAARSASSNKAWTWWWAHPAACSTCSGAVCST